MNSDALRASALSTLEGDGVLGNSATTVELGAAALMAAAVRKTRAV